MILELYKKLKKIADTEYGNIVEESEIIFSYTGRAKKLRKVTSLIAQNKHLREFLALVRKKLIEMGRKK